MLHPVRILSAPLVDGIVRLGTGYSPSSHVYGWLIGADCALGGVAPLSTRVTVTVAAAQISLAFMIMKRPAPQIKRNVVDSYTPIRQLIAKIALRRVGGNAQNVPGRLLVEIGCDRKESQVECGDCNTELLGIGRCHERRRNDAREQDGTSAA